MTKSDKQSSSHEIPFPDSMLVGVQQLNEMRTLLLAEAADLPETLAQLRDLPSDLRNMAIQLERATRGLEAFIQLASPVTDAAQMLVDARSNLMGLIEAQTNRLSRGEAISRDMLNEIRGAAQRLPDPTRFVPWMHRLDQTEE